MIKRYKKWECGTGGRGRMGRSTRHKIDCIVLWIHDKGNSRNWPFGSV